jgi:Flp pilus assembly pilin Flp
MIKGIDDPIAGGDIAVRRLKQFAHDETGADLVEWIVVTIILFLAIFAILQAVGDDILLFIQTVREAALRLIG